MESAGGLVGVAQIDRGRGLHHQRVDAGAAVDRGFGAVIGDGVVAGAGDDGVGATGAVDGIIAGAAGDDVGAGRA